MVVDVIERFSKKAPAAMLFRGLFARVFSDERMDQIFRDHKERQIESEIVFSSLIHLLTPVVSGGKRLDGTEHRLQETRRMKSSPLPGPVLAMLDTRLEMFVDLACPRVGFRGRDCRCLCGTLDD